MTACSLISSEFSETGFEPTAPSVRCFAAMPLSSMVVVPAHLSLRVNRRGPASRPHRLSPRPVGRAARRRNWPSRGAIPLGAPVIISLSRMNRILEVDTDSRIAWVEPGVVNLDLTKHLTPLGYHFAPDPSSQQVCTIGGNVGNNLAVRIAYLRRHQRLHPRHRSRARRWVKSSCWRSRC